MTLTINLPKPTSVETSIGTLYARYLNVGDLMQLAEIDLKAESDDKLGQLALQRTISREPDSQARPSLSDQDFNSLDEKDLRALTMEVAKLSDVTPSLDGPPVASFGQAVREMVLKFAESSRQSTEAMRKHISQSYAFLNDSTLGRLQDQLKGLTKLSGSAMGVGAYANRVMQRTAFDSNKGLVELARAAKSVGMTPVPEIQTIRPLPLIPRQEDTALGKAAIESARNSREVVQKIEALAEIVAGINRTLVEEVLPSWIKQVEHDQEAAQESFRHAAKGLWWTKWAVIVSVFVTVFVTWWQVSVAREIDAGNAAQMEKSEALLREQIELQKRLLESQERTLIELKGAPGKKKPGDTMKKEIGSQAANRNGIDSTAASLTR